MTETPKKTKKLHMIGNAHIDPVWLWLWQEGFHEVKASFRSALDLMKEYDDFIFVASSAAFYEWIEKSDPAMFAEIQQRVQEGRWELVGGWWVEPDCNIPSGESFVRHGLYAQRYFKEKFGRIAKTGFNIDSFGHSATLPQILKKSGIDHYVFLRPMPHERSLPSRLFWWEACDGSRILAFRIPFAYLSWGADLEAHALRCIGEMAQIIGRVLDKPIKYVNVPLLAARVQMLLSGMDRELVGALVEVDKELHSNKGAQLTDTVELISGRTARTFEVWCRENTQSFQG
jgi:alpha-mannosidase